MSNTMHQECYTCKHKRDVPGNAHVKCVKPDPKMTGHTHGITHGWFHYPSLFDPAWKTADCANYKAYER